jgi:hypothetical protein
VEESSDVRSVENRGFSKRAKRVEILNPVNNLKKHKVELISSFLI